MVCYICGRPASLCCPICRRYVCSLHTYKIGSRYVCFHCFELGRKEEEREQQKKDQEQQKKYRSTHYCDIHKCFHDDEYLKSDKWGSGLGIVVCRSEKGDCYSWEDNYHKQFCVNLAIQGTTEIHEGWDPELDRYADVLVETTNYLCPYCKHVVFVYEKIYKGDNGRYWWSPHRYLFEKSRWVRTYK